MSSEPQSPHLEIGLATRIVEVLCLAGAAVLLAVHAIRLVPVLEARWWMLPLIVSAGVCADVVSGVVHWAADSWGRETMPFVGPRFLRPFRVHHINPDDFLARSFVDCNGDVAMLTMPLLISALWIPLESGWGVATSLWLVAFVMWTLPTNQVHQWAHTPSPPRAVRWLQRHRVILSPKAHDRHHAAPYAVNYCIATGWCNGWLTSIDFFPKLERAITAVTGWHPRADEQAPRHRP